ncbi:hypothetical protein SARC_08834 [Sphaeroforma arctica JP610]|uniref:GST N-terminal domain-containing protein n=1 Tax=Sphaeroforma arctica JP610 TaxID=667725 RepID=A0A0L0FPV1_9EUKA|nr:hypothetical protein SARC_08834 [Sphaeroforma arctica JP610]KNC78739.1 hypothetical protein SARC_08834 [Sphaeroforma arctica JP610]|eukprot:XP_014152641.1 hypothetical protein SARC_08834 [Sphaeroforma arctica JP610]
MPTLHLYDHCPYCIRVELALGLMGIKYDRVLYGYGDMTGPTKLVGKKMLPIWEDDAGKFHVESMDIVSLLQSYATAENLFKPASNRADLKEWWSRFTPVYSGLTRPRFPRLPVKDFAEKADVDYHRSKYDKQNVDLNIEMSKTSEYIKAMSALLEEFSEKILYSTECMTEGGVSLDDIIYLPWFRNLTVVKGLEYPTKLEQYTSAVCAKANVELYKQYKM